MPGGAKGSVGAADGVAGSVCTNGGALPSADVTAVSTGVAGCSAARGVSRPGSLKPSSTALAMCRQDLCARQAIFPVKDDQDIYEQACADLS